VINILQGSQLQSSPPQKYHVVREVGGGRFVAMLDVLIVCHFQILN
jgi:hypothetical protein